MQARQMRIPAAVPFSTLSPSLRFAVFSLSVTGTKGFQSGAVQAARVDTVPPKKDGLNHGTQPAECLLTFRALNTRKELHTDTPPHLFLLMPLENHERFPNEVRNANGSKAIASQLKGRLSLVIEQSSACQSCSRLWHLTRSTYVGKQLEETPLCVHVTQ